MPRKRHIYPGMVDKLIDKLTPEAKESWEDFATSAKTLLELQAWWNQPPTSSGDRAFRVNSIGSHNSTTPKL